MNLHQPGGPKYAQRIYVASRASIPARAAMWRALRAQGVPIISSWIDYAGDGEGAPDWAALMSEVRDCTALLFYAEFDDFPLKGAFIEIGAALMAGKPVAVVLGDCSVVRPSYRPVGSWITHPLVVQYDTVQAAIDGIMKGSAA